MDSAKSKKITLSVGLFFLVGLVIIFSFSSCGRRSVEKMSSGKGEAVTITVWDRIPEENATAQERFVLERQKEFARLHPNIKVVHLSVPPNKGPQEWVQVITTALSGKEGPTIITGVLNSVILKSLAEKGWFADVTSYIEKWPEWKTVYPKVKEAVSVGGKVYAVPTNAEIVVLGYRKDLFKAAGLDPNHPPTNWQELADTAVKLTNRQKNQYGFPLLGTSFADWWFEYFVWQAGGDLTTLNPDGTVKLRYTEPPTVRALQFWQDLSFKYNCIQTDRLKTLDDIFQDWYQGRLGMTIFYPTWVTWQAPKGLSPENVNLALLPKDKVYAHGLSPLMVAFNSKASPEELEAAVEYAHFMYGREAILKQLEFIKENEVMAMSIPVYSDINFAPYFNFMPAQWQGVIKEAFATARLEFYGKERFDEPLNLAIQKAISTKTDVKKLLLQAEKETYTQYSSDYKFVR